jgi:hypothetical protein
MSIIPSIQYLSSSIAQKEPFLPQLQEVGLRLSIRSLDILQCLKYLYSGKEADIDYVALKVLRTAITRVEIDVWHPSIAVPTSTDTIEHNSNPNYPKGHNQNGKHVLERTKDELARVANVMVSREGRAGKKELGWRETKEGKVCNWNIHLKHAIAM